MKRVKVLDTNVLVRFLVGDNKKQQEAAEKYFQDAQRGDYNIVVHPLVVAEACFVLESFYNQPRIDIAEKMQVFLSQRWLKVQNRNILLLLWEDYLGGLYFVDSFLNSWAKSNNAEILTFDKELKNK